MARRRGAVRAFMIAAHVAFAAFSVGDLGAAADGAATAPTSCTKPPTVAAPIVEEVYKFGHPGLEDPERNRAGINDLIILKVSGLCLLIDQAKCIGAYAGPGCHEQSIALFLDGREIKGLVPESGAPRADVETLQYHLDRSAESDEQWADLLGAPAVGERFFERPASVSVGLRGDAPVQTKAPPFMLVRIHSIRFLLCAVILVLTIGAIAALAQNSALLRSSAKDSSYSLARCQMAFWFVLIVASFSFIWLITGAVDILTNTALILIGIGAGTALGAAVIDRSKDEALNTDLAKARAEVANLEHEVEALASRTQLAGATPEEAIMRKKEHADKTAELAAARAREKALQDKVATRDSKGFWTDILSDMDGIEFHRFQVVVWTVVLGLVFVHSVWARLAMPEFSATLLMLMGISSGTYLGFKIPEK